MLIRQLKHTEGVTLGSEHTKGIFTIIIKKNNIDDQKKKLFSILTIASWLERPHQKFFSYQ